MIITFIKICCTVPIFYYILLLLYHVSLYKYIIVNVITPKSDTFIIKKFPQLKFEIKIYLHD